MPLCPRWCSDLTPCSQCQMERLKPAKVSPRIPALHVAGGRKLRATPTARCQISIRNVENDRYFK